MSTRSDRGVVGMIVKGAVPSKNPLMVLDESDIPKNFSNENIKQIKAALRGYMETPKRVEVYCLQNDAENYVEALDYFEMSKVNYLCAPSCETDGQKDEIISWIKTQRENRKKIKAVLPNAEANSEGIINFTTESVVIDGASNTAEQMCARIAGILAGTPSNMSCTYAPLLEASDCTRLKRSELDTEINKGHLVVFNDGERVKIGRGINSLTAITESQNEEFKKIKTVETMDKISEDLTSLIEENYIGKYQNNYDNKCVVLCAVTDYFSELVRNGVLKSYSADIDALSNKAYLESKGISTADMSEAELKKADTGENVFMIATISILNAMEDVTINITI